MLWNIALHKGRNVPLWLIWRCVTLCWYLVLNSLFLFSFLSTQAGDQVLELLWGPVETQVCIFWFPLVSFGVVIFTLMHCKELKLHSRCIFDQFLLSLGIKAVILWYTILVQFKITFQFEYFFICNYSCDKNWIFSIITPVFSTTWSCRDHFNMLIWLSLLKTIVLLTDCLEMYAFGF